ncbi:MAG: cytochrome P450 [Planctomycetes bacterium]|nr:cytochrome P450 [Planctomycetota bacterium]
MSLVIDDLMAPDVIADPHAYYRELRETDPVHWNERWGGWVLTRYEDVVRVLRDSKRFSSDRMGFLARELDSHERNEIAPIFDVLSKWMVFADPPDHTRLRILLNRHLTPKSVEQYRPMVRDIVNGLLDGAQATGRMEVVRDFAYLVPMTAILELLGCAELDRDCVKEWSEQLGAFFFIRADEPRRREIACEGLESLTELLTPVIERKRTERGDDMISVLLDAEDEGTISPEEVLATCVLFVFGGHETTMNLIANGTLALMRHPDQWNLLRYEPLRIEDAVEELLRFDGSVKATVRWAKEDAEIGDRKIEQGQRVLVSLSGANRDPEVFTEPDVLDITRSPNAHVAFAHGIHVCIGANLARLEAQEAFTGLTSRLQVPTAEIDEIEYFPTVVGRAIKRLPISFRTLE